MTTLDTRTHSADTPPTPGTTAVGHTRRDALRKGAALAGATFFSTLGHSGVWAAGSDAPEKREVKIGFIPLTDCASVVMASVLGIDEKYGVKIVPTKEASWAGVRDKLINGELDMSHVLYGLIYGVHLGTAGPKTDMAMLMNLNWNGQAFTLSKRLADAGARDAASLARVMASNPREYTFAQTFPTGTHAMWLNYWLASAGVNPLRETRIITVPPPQMVANMRVGNMDGFCVGEPWNHRAIMDRIGVTAATTQDVWKDHPEKVLGTTEQFAQRHPNTCRAVVAAILKASQWIDSSIQNKRRTAETIAARAYVNTSVDVIVSRMLGLYEKRGSQLSVPERWHVVPYPAQALGPDQQPPRLPGRGQADQQDRYLQTSRDGLQDPRTSQRDAKKHPDRRRAVGRQQSRALCRQFCHQGLSPTPGEAHGQRCTEHPPRFTGYPS